MIHTYTHTKHMNSAFIVVLHFKFTVHVFVLQEYQIKICGFHVLQWSRGQTKFKGLYTTFDCCSLKSIIKFIKMEFMKCSFIQIID